jgi:hypothetical protein
MSTTPDPKPNFDRGKNGQFLKGFWKGGPGRGKRTSDAITHNFREALRQATSTAEAQEIFQEVIIKTCKNPAIDLETRLKAAEIYFDRTVGKPVPMDTNEQLDQMAEKLAELRALREAIDASTTQLAN